MSDAIAPVSLHRQPFVWLLISDLLFGAGFAVLAIASAMAPASLARPATSPVVLLGLVLVTGGGVLRIIAEYPLPTLGGGRH